MGEISDRLKALETQINLVLTMPDNIREILLSKIAEMKPIAKNIESDANEWRMDFPGGGGCGLG